MWRGVHARGKLEKSFTTTSRPKTDKLAVLVSPAGDRDRAGKIQRPPFGGCASENAAFHDVRDEGESHETTISPSRE